MSRALSVCVCTPLLLAAALPASALAQSPLAPPPWANKLFLPDIDKNPTQPPPAVVTHDFGTVPHGTLCVHKFSLTNVYDVPMQVTDVRRSCGCLEAYPPQRVLQPNESAEFAVTMNAAKFTGPNAQTIYVTVGPTYVSTAVIRMSANSRTDIALTPGQVNFGTVAQGAKPTQTAVLEYQGRQRDWKLTGFVPPAGPVDVAVTEVGRGLLGVKYQVAVTLKPDAPPGPVGEVVVLKTNDPAAPVVQVNVAGAVQAPITLSPGNVRFDRVKVGDVATYKVRVQSAARPFRIQSVPDDGDGLTIETFPAAAPWQTVTVKFQPLKPGRVRKEVKLATDLDGATATFVIDAEAEPGVAEK